MPSVGKSIDPAVLAVKAQVQSACAVCTSAGASPAMRLSLPERIPLTYAFLFASAVFVLQQIEHTSLYFSSCSFLFIVIATIGFNIAGGLTRPSGGYLFFFATLTLIVGLCVKIALGEPGDSRLLRPHVTITAYLVGICTLTLAVLASRKLSRKQPFLATAVTDRNLRPAAAGCLAVGILLTVVTHTVDRGQGTALSALIQINHFTEVALLLGIIGVIRRSGGRSSVDILVIISAGSLFVLNGVLGFSKEGMFSPFACWVAAAASERYRISRGQIIFGVALFAFLSYFMVPYSQYGRTQIASSFFGNIAVAEHLFETLPQVRRIYEAEQKQLAETDGSSYFRKSEGIFDRLVMVGVDDKLIDATVERGPRGYLPILIDFEALVPHILWPGKPTALWGNIYAHEAGINIPEDDFSTGISFSAVGEGYHLGEWAGLLLLCPVIWTLSFLCFDSLCGDIRNSPWGLLVLIFFAHVAPEGYLSGLIYATVYVGFAIAFAALTAGYIMPLLGALFIGPNRQDSHLTAALLRPRVRERLTQAAATSSDL